MSTVNLTTQIQNRIDALTGSEDLKDLLILAKAAEGLDVDRSNLDSVLETKYAGFDGSTEAKDLLVGSKSRFESGPQSDRVGDFNKNLGALFGDTNKDLIQLPDGRNYLKTGMGTVDPDLYDQDFFVDTLGYGLLESETVEHNLPNFIGNTYNSFKPMIKEYQGVLYAVTGAYLNNNNGVDLYKSEDLGQTWTYLNTVNERIVNFYLVQSNGRMILSGGYESGNTSISYSDDLGLTWQTTDAYGGYSSTHYSMHVEINEQTGEAVHIQRFDAAGGYRYRFFKMDSDFNGVSYTTAGPSSNAYYWSVTNWSSAVLTDENIFVLCIRGRLGDVSSGTTLLFYDYNSDTMINESYVPHSSSSPNTGIIAVGSDIYVQVTQNGTIYRVEYNFNDNTVNRPSMGNYNGDLNLVHQENGKHLIITNSEVGFNGEVNYPISNYNHGVGVDSKYYVTIGSEVISLTQTERRIGKIGPIAGAPNNFNSSFSYSEYIRIK